jgi:hypothetical protein
MVRSLVWWTGCIEAMTPCRAKRGQVGRIDDLRMFDPPAPVSACRLDCEFGIGIKCLRISRIANGVDCNLESVERRPAHDVAAAWYPR